MQVKLSVTNRHRRRRRSVTGTPDRRRRAGGPMEPIPARTRSRSGPVEPSLQVLPSPAAGSDRSRAFLPVPTGRRGVFELPPQQSWAHDPFGLFGATGSRDTRGHRRRLPAPLSRSPRLRAPSPSVGIDRRPGHSGSGKGSANSKASVPTWPATGSASSTGRPRPATGRGSSASSATEGRSPCPSPSTIGPGVHRRTQFERLVAVTLWVLTEAPGRSAGAPAHVVGPSIHVRARWRDVPRPVWCWRSYSRVGSARGPPDRPQGDAAAHHPDRGRRLARRGRSRYPPADGTAPWARCTGSGRV